MANEVTASVTLQYRKGTKNTTRQGTVTVDSASPLEAAGTITIGTSEEAIPMADVTAPGHSYWKNVGDTNPVCIRAATGDANLVELKPGEAAMFPLVATAPYAIAIGGNTQLEYSINSR